MPQTNSLYTPFKRTSSIFGSRLWSDLPLPINECNDNDIDFNQLPELRKKASNDNEKVLRANSLQPNLTQRVKQPLARHISSPMRLNYGTKPKDINRSSDTSAASSFSSKMSFRRILRTMSSKHHRQQPTEIVVASSSPPTAAPEVLRDNKRKSNKRISIRQALVNNLI